MSRIFSQRGQRLTPAGNDWTSHDRIIAHAGPRAIWHGFASAVSLLVLAADRTEAVGGVGALRQTGVNHSALGSTGRNRIATVG